MKKYIMFHCFIILISIVFSLNGWTQPQHQGKVEIYIGGERYSSIDEYKQHKRNQELNKNIPPLLHLDSSRPELKKIVEILAATLGNLSGPTFKGLNTIDFEKILQAINNKAKIEPAPHNEKHSDLNKMPKESSISFYRNHMGSTEVKRDPSSLTIENMMILDKSSTMPLYLKGMSDAQPIFKTRGTLLK